MTVRFRIPRAGARPRPGWLAACLGCGWILPVAWPLLAADPPGPRPPPEPLETFLRVPQGDARERWLPQSEVRPGSAPASVPRPGFRAVRPKAWYAGLIPLYAIDLETRVELRRLPGRGQENFSEPLCFALPPPDEPAGTRQIVGRWEVKALRGDKSPALFAWELAAEGTRVAGRFEQLTDFRFAYLTDGSFRENRLELTVEYVADRFEVRGDWQAGSLRGTWRRLDDAEAGTWEARQTLEPAPPLPTDGRVALYEWRRVGAGTPERRYELDGTSPGEGWQRAERPLAWVWQP